MTTMNRPGKFRAMLFVAAVAAVSGVSGAWLQARAAMASSVTLDYRRPSQADIEEGKWFIKPLTSGGHKGIIRVRVKDLNPGERYVLRVTVTNQGTGEESMIDTPPLTTEPEQDA